MARESVVKRLQRPSDAPTSSAQISALAKPAASPRRITRKAIAVHEAGHLFAHLAQFPATRILGIWINRNSRGRWEGCLRHKHGFDWKLADLPFSGPADVLAKWGAIKRDTARKELIVSLAGPVASVRWRLRSRALTRQSGGRNARLCFDRNHEPASDFGKAKRYLDLLGDVDPHAAFEEAWIETEAILHEHWKAVDSVASLLAERLRIEGAELYRLPEVEAVGRDVAQP